MITIKKTFTFIIAFIAIISVSNKVMSQMELPIHIQCTNHNTYVMTSEYSYKNIFINSEYYGSPFEGTYDPGVTSYYYFDGETKIKSSLKDLLNSNSTELLNLINAAFKEQFNDLKNSKDPDTKICAENLGDFKPYSFEYITLSFEIDVVEHYSKAVFSIQELGMLWNCKFCDSLTFSIELSEFDKFLK